MSIKLYFSGKGGRRLRQQKTLTLQRQPMIKFFDLLILAKGSNQLTSLSKGRS